MCKCLVFGVAQIKPWLVKNKAGLRNAKDAQNGYLTGDVQPLITMLQLQSTLYIIAITLCVFSTGILQSRARTSGVSYTYFSAFLGVEASCFLLEWLMIQPAIPFKALWLSLLIAVSFVSAPCLWLATRELMNGAPLKLGAVHPGHLGVILFGVLLTLPLLETTHGGYSYISATHSYSFWYGRFIHVTMVMAVGIYCLQVPFYLRRCVRILQRKPVDVPADGNVLIRWLMIIIAGTWMLSMVRTLVVLAGPFEISRLAIAVGDVVVTIVSLYVIVSKFSPREPAVPSVPAYAHSTLDLDTRMRIRSKIDRAIEEQVYRDNMLSLRSLSAKINERPHLVSQVISQEYNTNFYQLINQNRIAMAKVELRANPGRTVLDIAYSVGFNTKSTFNSAFRKYTSTTPRRYREGS